MDIQNYLLCILYVFLIIAHSFTLCSRDFYRKLISIFSCALFAATISTALITFYQTVITYGIHIIDLTKCELCPISTLLYVAHLLYIISINLFILFLLIVAKGWPITRSDMPFKYAFAIFWILCLSADLISFYWNPLTNLIIGNHNNNTTTAQIETVTNATTYSPPTSTMIAAHNESSSSSTTVTPTSANSSDDSEEFNSTPQRLRLLLRIVVMIYFLLDLRKTMIIEQEKKKLQFYLHFGALSMVWFVHSLIVYVISLRVELIWQSQLISGFSSAADFIAFAVTTYLLFPKSSRSYLFKKHNRSAVSAADDPTSDHLSGLNDSELAHDHEEEEEAYDGLEMRELNSESSNNKLK